MSVLLVPSTLLWVSKAIVSVSKESEHKPLVSVVMPCLNEEEGIGTCIATIQETLAANKIDGEIVVCDNGSTDRSVEIATSMGVNVVHERRKGYGNAYICGFKHARGKYLVMGDADDTYDFRLIPQFLQKLVDEGYDFVTGNRYSPGGYSNITFSHRYIGNPMLTLIMNILFGTTYKDVYSGYRAFSHEAYRKIRPVSPGMEFNLELAINAHLAGLKIAEIPIKLGPRKGTAKLDTLRDGWRSLRMMLLYCPKWVFFVPGALSVLLGISLHVITLFGLVTSEGRALGTVTAIFATIFTVSGVQIISLGMQAQTYSWSRRYVRAPMLREFYTYFKLETGLVLGCLLLLAGLGILVSLVVEWLKAWSMPLAHPHVASLAATLIMVGLNVIFTSLFISAMSMGSAKAEIGEELRAVDELPQ